MFCPGAPWQGNLAMITVKKARVTLNKIHMRICHNLNWKTFIVSVETASPPQLWDCAEGRRRRRIDWVILLTVTALFVSIHFGLEVIPKALQASLHRLETTGRVDEAMAGTLTLHLPLLLLLLPTGSHASHYYGTVMTFTPKDSGEDGSVRVGTPTMIKPELFISMHGRNVVLF